jgi:putative transcriptional regulator
MKTHIKELRARYDLTQEDLAKKVGVRRETILFIEKGNYNPSLQLAHDIAKALQTTINDLFIFKMNKRISIINHYLVGKLGFKSLLLQFIIHSIN